MINAKQINILSETEVPFGTDTGFGSNYNIDVLKTRYYKDVTELIEDDNYIISTATNGCEYAKNNRRYKFCRNNYATDEAGSKFFQTLDPLYSAYDYTSDKIPGYVSKTFDRDILALVWNADSDPTVLRPLYTGDAYCIKTLSISRGTYYGNDCFSVDMYAKSLIGNAYSNYNICVITRIFQNNTSCVFLPNGLSTLYFDDGAYGGTKSNEAKSVICNKYQLISRISSLFLRLPESGASDTDIINYITDQMPYGGIIIEPWTSLYVYDGSTYNNITVGTFHFTFSQTINPIPRHPVYPNYPTGDGAKSWIIPFNSEEEYHAACCAKKVFTFSPY